MTHMHHSAQSANLSSKLETLLTISAGASLRLSALDALLKIASKAGEDKPLTGGEIAATLEPLQEDLIAFFELCESTLKETSKAARAGAYTLLDDFEAWKDELVMFADMEGITLSEQQAASLPVLYRNGLEPEQALKASIEQLYLL